MLNYQSSSTTNFKPICQYSPPPPSNDWNNFGMALRQNLIWHFLLLYMYTKAKNIIGILRQN